MNRPLIVTMGDPTGIGPELIVKALLAGAFGLLAPLTSLGQVVITPDGPLLSGWAAAMYFTVRAIDEERGRWLLLAGLAAGCAALGKYTAFILLPQVRTTGATISAPAASPSHQVIQTLPK